MLLFNSPTFQLSNLPFRAGAGRRASVAGGAREVYRGRFGVCVKVRRPTPNAPAPTLYSVESSGIRSATRSFALRARGLRAISAGVGVIGFLVKTRKNRVYPFVQAEYQGGRVYHGVQRRWVVFAY